MLQLLKCILTLALSCYFSSVLGVTDPHKHIIKYDISYENNKNQPYFTITLAFESDKGKTTLIKLPSCSSCATKLYNDVEDIKATNGILTKTANPSQYLLTHASNSPVIISYKMKQGWEGQPTNFMQSRSPLFQQDYFRLKGEHLLIYPLKLKTQPVKMEITWHVPSKWIVINSFGSDQNNQTISAPLEDILGSLFFGGTFHLYKTKVKGGYIWSALQNEGNWKFSATQFNNLIIKIITTQREFWNDYSFSNFLVSLIPVGTTCNSMSGAGLKNSFTLNLATDCTLDNKNIIHLISHENFHLWNGMIPVFKDQEDNEPLYAWFAEGFTEYYSKLFNLRSNLITFEDYIKDYNKVLVDYYSSPYKLLAIDKLEKIFWKDIDAQLLPYKQGEIIAHNWNMKIKQHTKNQKSLDDLMRIFINPNELKGQHLTINKMNILAQDYFGNDFLKKNISALYNGTLQVPDKDALGICVYQINKMLAPYELGFDATASKKTGFVTSVNTKSKAYAAGLRDGQKLLSIDFQPDDINHKILLKISENNRVRTFSYWPYKGELQSIPQYELNRELWNKSQKECLMVFN